MSPRKCLWCGDVLTAPVGGCRKSFIYAAKKKKYCSWGCRSRGLARVPKEITQLTPCEYCAKPIPAVTSGGKKLFPSQYVRLRFCSRACGQRNRVKQRPLPAEKACQACGAPISPFQRSGRRKSASNYGRQLFCNVTCREDFNSKVPRKNTLAEHFWSLVDPSAGADGCWPVHPAVRNANNYGYIQFHGQRYWAHRLALELSGASVPQELFVLHRCDNPPCCNPSHLEVGTLVENSRQMAARGRGVKKWRYYGRSPALSFEQVKKIRQAHALGETYRALGKAYGLCGHTIRRAVRGLGAYDNVPQDAMPASLTSCQTAPVLPFS